METLTAIALMVVAAIFIVVMVNPESFTGVKEKLSGAKSNGMRPRAYHSCPAYDCDKKKVTQDDLLVKNPFVWPYSGSETPEVVMEPEPAKVPKGKVAEKYENANVPKKLTKEADTRVNIYDVLGGSGARAEGMTGAETDHDLDVN